MASTRPLVLVPDPRLREIAQAVDAFDPAFRSLVADMRATVMEANGIGLAAPQVGEGLRLALVNRLAGRQGEEWVVLVNPVLERYDGEQLNAEGCLSIPGVRIPIRRPARALIRAQDEKGRARTYPFFGLAAACAMHEMDHLNGVLITDREQGLAIPGLPTGSKG